MKKVIMLSAIVLFACSQLAFAQRVQYLGKFGQSLYWDTNKAGISYGAKIDTLLLSGANDSSYSHRIAIDNDFDSKVAIALQTNTVATNSWQLIIETAIRADGQNVTTIPDSCFRETYCVVTELSKYLDNHYVSTASATISEKAISPVISIPLMGADAIRFKAKSSGTHSGDMVLRVQINKIKE